CEDLFITSLRGDRRDVVLWLFGSEDNAARVNRRLRKVHASGDHASRRPDRGSVVYATRPRGMSLRGEAGAKWFEAKLRQPGPTLDVTCRLVKSKDLENPVHVWRVSFERQWGRFRMLDLDEQAPEQETVRKSGGRPAKFSVEAVFALRTKYPQGIAWADVRHV